VCANEKAQKSKILKKEEGWKRRAVEWKNVIILPSNPDRVDARLICIAKAAGSQYVTPFFPASFFLSSFRPHPPTPNSSPILPLVLPHPRHVYLVTFILENDELISREMYKRKTFIYRSEISFRTRGCT
jgi:hypothetical protein